MSNPSITVVVVSRGLDALLRQCLVSLQHAMDFAQLAPASRVIVVDNASPRPYRDAVLSGTRAQLMRFDRHHGFAAANNQAVRAAPNAAYLLLNNDVLLDSKALAAMLAVIVADRDVGICGTRLVFPDNSIQHAGVVFGADDIGPYHVHRQRHSDLVPRVDRDFQAVTGACLLVTHDTWHASGGLDEDFGFGLEDIDFCLRARQQGWRVRCSQSTESIHFESMTPGRVERDIPARRLFMQRWKGRYSIDG